MYKQALVSNWGQVYFYFTFFIKNFITLRLDFDWIIWQIKETKDRKVNYIHESEGVDKQFFKAISFLVNVIEDIWKLTKI